jgi:hypothetical protein
MPSSVALVAWRFSHPSADATSAWSVALFLADRAVIALEGTVQAIPEAKP